jgi:hypothetical protein
LLPSTWRKKFDLDGYVGTKAKLILECKAIKRNKSVKERERKDNVHKKNLATDKEASKKNHFFAPHLPQGSQHPCAQGRKKESLGPIRRCT